MGGDRTCALSFQQAGARLSEGEAARITGHAQKGITYGVYSTGPGLAILKGNVEKLRYDDVAALKR